MFYQVRVTPKDRDSLRFLWWPGGNLDLKPVSHRMKVHLFGATSSPCCAAFCLRQSAIDFGQEFEPYVAHAIENNFYVDDLLISVPDSETGLKLVEGLRSLLARAGFRLTKWLSNCEKVMNNLPKDEHSKSFKLSALDRDKDEHVERVLGINWKFNLDVFCFNISLPWKPRTKRGMLSTMNSVFDPLGFVSPVILEARLLYRKLCELDLEWDEPFPETELFRWEKWLETLPCLQQISIPRWIGMSTTTDYQKFQLHYFVDASKEAYGAVCYLRIVSVNDKVICRLLMSKSYLAPKDETSIPRLELLAAVTAVKMDMLLSTELNLNLRPSIFWTDSSIVLHSIANERKRFPLFVSRRLAVIAKYTCASNWNHVPTKCNPADILSRGCRADVFLKKELWLTGPEFLKENPSLWSSRFRKEVLSDGETKRYDKEVVSLLIAPTEASPVNKLISSFSSLFKLKRATAWLLKFKLYLVSRIRKEKNPISCSITVDELREAEAELIKYEQRQCFGEMLKRVPEGIQVLPKSPLQKLNPVMIDGILRVGGRLDKAPISFNARHPVILPFVSHLTDLIVFSYHEIAGHAGISFTMNLLTQKFWILKATSAVRRVINNCVHCRRRNAKPGQQIMAELPSVRLQIDSHPFAYTGVDFFGPLIIRQKRSNIKRYGCLFTCLTSRAIHLEVAADLSADAFINALRRFLSRRGPVFHIFSDNGTNFVGAERILRESIQEWNQHQIEDFLHQREIEWSFICPSASHMGGCWERMIRSVRRILTSLCGERELTEDQLHTFLLEVESILNSRPLTPVTMDLEGKEALTPNHLLKLHPAGNLPPTITDPSDCYSKRRWRHEQYLSDQFWKRWSKEYLRLIMGRQKWFKRKPNLRIDDVVLITDDHTPRSQWRIGRIIATHPDAYGVVRTVSIKTSTTELRRPIYKVCLIVPSNDVVSKTEEDDSR